MQFLFDQLNADRNAKIDSLIANNPHLYPDRMFAAMDVDMDAPFTSNWKMLEMIGIDPATATLPDIIEGLKAWGVYIVNYTPSEEFLAYLRSDILHEAVRLIPPSEDSKEFIDMSTGKFAGTNAALAG
jgi:hypothetical protein